MARYLFSEDIFLYGRIAEGGRMDYKTEKRRIEYKMKSWISEYRLKMFSLRKILRWL